MGGANVTPWRAQARHAMTTDVTKRLDDALEMSDDELAAELPALLDDLDARTEEILREHPALFGRVAKRMEGMDVAEFVSNNPEAADQFQDVLWTGTEMLVERSPDVRELITEDITVNFEATDCPMTGHLAVDEAARTITGGSGHVEDPTLEITGPADVLVGLVTGSVDPIQGFMQRRYEMDGPVQKGTALAPIMNSLSDSVPG